jgi:hypothetical protein
MKDFLLNKPQGWKSWAGFVIMTVMLFISSKASAQLCDPVVDGDAFVCPSTLNTYVATRGEVGSTLSWTLSGGGSILALENDNTEASIEWSDVAGGPYYLIVTESTSTCSETFVFEVVIESESISLACNDMVNVALDENCEAEITPDMLLEDPQYGPDSYTVHLSDQNFEPIPGNVVDIQYLNEIINVTIEHNCSGLTCWGKISVQDNIAPGLDCRPDVIEIECDESYAPENVGFPLPPTANTVKVANNEYSVIVPGDCGGAYTLVYSDVVENWNCGDAYDFYVTRTWIATDESGNSTSCEEYIGAVWGSLNNMTLPPHYDGITQLPNHLEKLQCSYAHLKNYWPHDYNPGPDVTGYPEWSGCSNIQYYYEDMVFHICGNSRKIVRHWLILDWCTGEDYVYDQLIIIEDDAGPIVTAVRDTLYYPTLPGECYGTAYPIPAPIVLFDCSAYSYTISYKLRDESGQPALNAITDNVFEGPEGFGISGLPVDTTWVMYNIVDECGNETVAFTEIVIEDYEAPTAVCDKHTVVTLSPEGTAKMYAASVDDGSNDNCGIDYFEIRRMDTPCGHPEDLEFGEVVHFCCEDVGEPVLVVFRVYDLKGHYSDCMVEVAVQDKLPPEFTECPPDVYLECGQDWTDLNLTGGEPVVSDNCDTYDLEYFDYPNLGDCGTGYIRRDWRVTDGAGLTDLCRQYIYIEDNNPLTYDDMDWPADISLNGCVENDTHPDNTGWPVLNNTACKDLGVSYTDQLLNDIEGVCYRILREWKVADWCETPPFDYITHTQVIEVLETSDPYFTSCSNIDVDADNETCDALVTVVAQAEDDCTPANELNYTWEVDFDQDGSIDDNGIGNAFTRTFPTGKHWVYFEVSDGCGNYNTCRLQVSVKDTKDPTPICLAKVTTTMMQTGMLPVQASSFNLCQCSSGSFDNCTPKEDLRFSFSSDVNDTERVFTCDDITNGVAESFELEMWVTDLDGNQDFCNVTLVIMDNVDACEDAPNASASLAGLIIDEMHRGMPDFEVELEKDDTQHAEQVTDEEGQYVFENLDVYSKYKLKPQKDNDPSNGVSTLDLVLIQKHILGLRELDTPFKMIAADANNTGSISAGDLLDIRSLILGLTPDYQNNDSWRFINGKYEFEDPRAPWDFEEEFVVDALYIDSDSVDFIGIKVGDVNNSAVENLLGNDVEPRSSQPMLLKAKDVELNAGDETEISIYLEESMTLEGMQFTLQYDPNLLKIQHISSPILHLRSSNVNYFNEGEGLLTLSWNDLTSVELSEGQALFELKVIGLNKAYLSEILELNSAYTQAEAYDESLNKMQLELRFENEETKAFTVYQNTPNPFEDETAIRFYLPESKMVRTTVFDGNGKVVHEVTGHYSKGNNTITLSKEMFDYQGLYFYQLTDGESTVVRKMIYTR